MDIRCHQILWTTRNDDDPSFLDRERRTDEITEEMVDIGAYTVIYTIKLNNKLINLVFILSK